MAEDKDQGLPEMMRAMMAMNPLASKAWMDVIQESTRFVTERLEQDFETQKAMLSAKDPAELMRLQQEFLQKAFAEYGAEATKLLGMMGDAATESTKDAINTAKRGYDDIPL